MSYVFTMPNVCHVGEGALRNLATEIRRMNVKRSLLICDPGIVKSGLSSEVEDILRSEHVAFEVFSDVELEPSTDSVETATEAAKKEKYDVLIGLGGGSSLDVTKGVSVLVTNGGDIRDYIGIEAVPRRGLPTILIPTTAGTGAESTCNAIFALKDEQVKKGVVSRYLQASVAIVDPKLTLSCPPRVTAGSGMDALVHAVESYTGKKTSVQTDMYAFRATELIAGALRRAVLQGDDIDARNAMAWGSFLAGVAIANAGTGGVHALSYPLGGKFHVSHGIANALLFPYVMQFNVEGNPRKFAKVAMALGERMLGEESQDISDRLVRALRKLSLDIGIPQKLRDVGVAEKDLEEMTKAAKEQERLLVNNPVPMTEKDILGIYAKAL